MRPLQEAARRRRRSSGTDGGLLPAIGDRSGAGRSRPWGDMSREQES